MKLILSFIWIFVAATLSTNGKGTDQGRSEPRCTFTNFTERVSVENCQADIEEALLESDEIKEFAGDQEYDLQIYYLNANALKEIDFWLAFFNGSKQNILVEWTMQEDSEEQLFASVKELRIPFDKIREILDKAEQEEEEIIINYDPVTDTVKLV